jgi:hypothetical protein
VSPKCTGPLLVIFFSVGPTIYRFSLVETIWLTAGCVNQTHLLIGAEDSCIYRFRTPWKKDKGRGGPLSSRVTITRRAITCGNYPACTMMAALASTLPPSPKHSFFNIITQLPKMSFHAFPSLPKEIRLQVWTLAYFSQPPRLVALRTKPHDEDHPEEDTFCPRYSPSPAPTIVNTCHEARTEAQHQARSAGHLVRLHVGKQSTSPAEFTQAFYFRFETDILYLPLEDRHVAHYDDSPEVGFLAHLRQAYEVDATALRHIAITRVIWSAFRDGSTSNCLREFPNIEHITSVIPSNCAWLMLEQLETFKDASEYIVRLYQWDVKRLYGERVGKGQLSTSLRYAVLNKGELEIVATEPRTFLDQESEFLGVDEWRSTSLFPSKFEGKALFER